MSSPEQTDPNDSDYDPAAEGRRKNVRGGNKTKSKPKARCGQRKNFRGGNKTKTKAGTHPRRTGSSRFRFANVGSRTDPDRNRRYNDNDDNDAVDIGNNMVRLVRSRPRGGASASVGGASCSS